MNHALLKSVIYDQHEFIRNFQIVPRDYEFEENGNYVLVGLRRAGKSTLLYKIVLDLVASGVGWEQIIYINFEDERLSEFTVADFNDLLSVQSEMSDKKGYFFLDEVQNIDGWEKFARRMADASTGRPPGMCSFGLTVTHTPSAHSTSCVPLVSICTERPRASSAAVNSRRSYMHGSPPVITMCLAAKPSSSLSSSAVDAWP